MNLRVGKKVCILPYQRTCFVRCIKFCKYNCTECVCACAHVFVFVLYFESADRIILRSLGNVGMYEVVLFLSFFVKKPFYERKKVGEGGTYCFPKTLHRWFDKVHVSCITLCSTFPMFLFAERFPLWVHRMWQRRRTVESVSAKARHLYRRCTQCSSQGQRLL